jgi:hypothetical protein
VVPRPGSCFIGFVKVRRCISSLATLAGVVSSRSLSLMHLQVWINRFQAKANTCNATIELGSLRRPAPLAIALLPVSPSKGTPEAPVVCHGTEAS